MTQGGRTWQSEAIAGLTRQLLFWLKDVAPLKRTGLRAELVAGNSGPIKFGSILVLGADDNPVALVCVWMPLRPADLPELLAAAAEAARAVRAGYFVTYNVRDTCLWQTPSKGVLPSQEHLLKRYATVGTIPKATSPTVDAFSQNKLRARVQQLVADLHNLHRYGHLRLVDVDATFFVHRLTESVRTLCPWIQRSLVTTVDRDPSFKSALAAWSARQGIPNFGDELFYTGVARQVVYRLLGKIIFYQSLRRQARHLPELDFKGLDQAAVMPRLAECFAQARAIDYQAVFEQDIIDGVPFPLAAVEELIHLTDDLNRYNFAAMPQEVLGEVFERLIPPEERHALGQYFTREDLVDLILAFCLRSKDDTVLDPTCGTGTFLLRAYDHHRTLGETDHSRLLSRLWGIDIAPFPAELATINLYRQNLAVSDNFPRIVCKDFFEVRPGQTFRFPPPKPTNTGPDFIDEALPVFDAAVGNFPFIRRELVERRVPGYRALIRRSLASEWLACYPDLFRLPREARDDLAFALAHGHTLEPLYEKAEVDLSYYCDLYAYLLVHAVAFVRPNGGRLGFVTSNAYLDAEYGDKLQRFLMGNCKVISVIESRCEPWFEQADVNTVVTVLERCPCQDERESNLVRFVRVKKPLTELIGSPTSQPLDRWKALGGIADRVMRMGDAHEPRGAVDGGGLDTPMEFEDHQLRVRVVRQGALGAVPLPGQPRHKWGLYLRAPSCVFDIMRRSKPRLATLGQLAVPSIGGESRINEFFHLSRSVIQQWGIEPQYCWPLLKSPSSTDRVDIDPESLPLRLFVCRRTKEELGTLGHLGALRYIEWGEQQVYQAGPHAEMMWPEGRWLRGRKPGWWALPESETKLSQLFLPAAYFDRFIVFSSDIPVVADKRLNALAPVGGVEPVLLTALLNSTWMGLMSEVSGRVTLGQGALELLLGDARDCVLLPDPRKLSDRTAAAIVAAFRSIRRRPIGSIFEEVQRADRRELDSAVLRAMGISPAKYLDAIYEGITSLVRERMELGRMRGTAKSTRVRRDTSKVMGEAVAEVFPDGPRAFPDDFLDLAAKRGEFREIAVPDEPLVVDDSGLFCGVVSEASEFHLRCKNPVEAKYIVYARYNGLTTIRLPVEQINLFRTVKAYESYLRESRRALLKRLSERTLDHRKAAQLAQRAWTQLGLPSLVDDI